MLRDGERLDWIIAERLFVSYNSMGVHVLRVLPVGGSWNNSSSCGENERTESNDNNCGEV